MAQVREKFATQVDAKVLRKLRKLAEQEGRQLQVLGEEALTDLLIPRPRTSSSLAFIRRIPSASGSFSLGCVRIPGRSSGAEALPLH